MINEFEFNLMVEKAKHRIRDLYYGTSGACYLAFSGGKDSTVVLALIKLCEESGMIKKNCIPAVFCDTKIELDATLEFVKWCAENYYGNVEIIQTEKPFGTVIKESGKPIKSKMKSELLSRYQKNPQCKTKRLLFGEQLEGQSVPKRTKLANKDMHLLHPDFDIKISNDCCEEMKKKPFKKYVKEHGITGYFNGERMAEGGIRSVHMIKNAKAGKNICTRIQGDITLKCPIVDWSDEMVDMFIEKYNVPLSKAYTEYGMDRTGCFLCPFSLTLENNLQVLHDFEPNKYKAALSYLKDVYIAQGVKIPFDEEYEKERIEKWNTTYHKMRHEMLKVHRPDCKMCKDYEKLGGK